MDAIEFLKKQKIQDIVLNPNDKPELQRTLSIVMEHYLYAVLCNASKLHQPAVISAVCSCGNKSVEEYNPSCSLKCALNNK